MSTTEPKPYPVPHLPEDQNSVSLEKGGQQNHQHADDLFERITDAYVSLDTQWRSTYVNHQAEMLLGKTRDELLGKVLWEVFPTLTTASIYQNLHTAMQEQIPLEYTKYHSTLGKWYSIRLFPSQQSLAIFFQDITAQKRAEEQLHYYASLTQSISDAVISTDMHYHILGWNDAAEILYGWKREEVLGKPVSAILHSDFPYASKHDSITQLQSEGFWKGEVTQQRKDGTLLHILSTVSVMKDSVGETIGAVSVNRDIAERKQLEEKLRLSEIRYRTMIEQSPLSVQIFSPDGKAVQVNRAWEELWGVTFEQIPEYNILKDEQLVTEGIMPFIQKAFAGEAAAIPPVKYEPDKTVPHMSSVPYRWVRAFIYPVKDEHGNIREVVLMHEDITEARQAEETVRQNEKRYRVLIENNADAVVLINPHGTILYISPSITSMLGYTPEELIGQNTLAFVHPDDRATIARVLRGILQEAGKTVTTYYRLQHKDGSWRWIEGTGTNLLHDPSVGAIVGNFHDISERKQLEEEIAQAKEQLETIFQNVADGITVQDASGRIVYANDVAAQSIGLPSAQAMLSASAHTLSDVLSRFEMKDEWGEPIPWEQLPGRRALLGEEHIQTTVQYFDKLSGKTRWSLLKAQPIFDDAGHVQLAVNVFTDITQHRELELRKDEFISMASHELKTPVTSIKGFTQLLQRRFQKRGDEESLRFLARMDSQLNKLTNLVSDLLDLSKMQSGKIAFREEPFELSTLVQEIVENVQGTTQTHQLHLESTTAIEVYGDKDRIGQVLINLLTNAIKYSPQADSVIVRVSKELENAFVSVQDFGIGIGEAHQKKIFERFYQVTDPMEKTFPGLGIGLYISSEIIKRHRGHMQVESKKGGGSTFSFSLPLCQDQQARSL